MKSKTFDEIQKLYEREQKWINDFVPMDSKVDKDSRKGKAKGSRKKIVARKRTCEKLDDESVKRQKIEDDAKKEELRAYLDIIPGDDEAVNFKSLAIKTLNPTQDLVVKEKMESQSETSQMVSALKLPVLKTGEYDLWSMRMEQYLTFTDHALWEVIVNGDSVTPVASASAGAEGPIPPKTAKQKLARKNKLKV
ncbi:hypothetical protein Tco_1206525 [Tanacetum coccineum]